MNKNIKPIYICQKLYLKHHLSKINFNNFYLNLGLKINLFCCTAQLWYIQANLE